MSARGAWYFCAMPHAIVKADFTARLIFMTPGFRNFQVCIFKVNPVYQTCFFIYVKIYWCQNLHMYVLLYSKQKVDVWHSWLSSSGPRGKGDYPIFACKNKPILS
jgi:hypothetical protein